MKSIARKVAPQAYRTAGIPPQVEYYLGRLMAQTAEVKPKRKTSVPGMARKRIISLLRRNPRRRYELTEATGIPSRTITDNLKKMEDEGEIRYAGRMIHYVPVAER